MRKITIILFLVITGISYAQQDKILASKYGYINKEGKEITDLKYDNADSFSEGIAKVSLKGKWGFINKDGKEITLINYDKAYTFKNGVARIKLNGKYGLIDVTGKEITELKYDNIGRFDHDVACVKINGKCGIIDNKGNEITPLKYDYMQKTDANGILCLKGKDKDKITLLDENHKPIESNPLGFFSDDASYFDESGIAKVCLNGKWGFIDKTGKEISAIKYDYVFFFSEGMARVLLNNKWGFINELGTEVIPLVYDFLDESMPFDFKSDREIGHIFESLISNYVRPIYLYKDGKHIDYYDSEYLDEEHTYFNHGLVCVHAKNIYPDYNWSAKYPKYIFLDKKGKEVKSTISDSVANLYYISGRTKMQFFYDDLRLVEKYENGHQFGFTDTLGNFVIPFRYGYCRNFNDGVAVVSRDGKSGLINTQGEEITPLKYSSVDFFFDGIARFYIEDRNGRKWAIINNKGEELTPIKYDFINDFKEGFAMVELRKKIGFIDKNGNEIIKPIYSNGDSFNEGFADVVYAGKVGFIDKTGREITPFKYDETHSFKNGFARVRINNKWGCINSSGEEITSLKYDEIEDFKEDFAVVKMINE